MATPLPLPEMLRFAVASLRQLGSAQGPAYLWFLSRVLTRHPAMLREAFTLAAQGHHLRKITEQVTAMDNLNQYLAHGLAHLHADMARRAHEGQTRLTAHVRRQYGRIHDDFRPEVDEALTTFVRALDTSLHAFDLRVPRRFFHHCVCALMAEREQTTAFLPAIGLDPSSQGALQAHDEDV